MFRYGGKFSGSSGSENFDVCRSQPSQVAKTFPFDRSRCFPSYGSIQISDDSTFAPMDITVGHGTTP